MSTPSGAQARRLTWRAAGTCYGDRFSNRWTSASRIVSAQGRDDEVEVIFKRVHADRLRTLGASHPDTANGLRVYGRFLAARRRFAEAQPLISESLAIRNRVLGPNHPDTIRAARELVALHRATGQQALADDLERTLR